MQLWSTGAGNNGRLGHGNYTSLTTFTRVGTDDWDYAAAGHDFSTGIKADGTLWTWGGNLYGSLGLGDTSSRNVPVQVGSSTWTAVACGLGHTIAIRSDGTLWSWGMNGFGQLGIGDTTQRNSPVLVSSESWVAVSCSAYASYAIDATGKLWACGKNINGQLGLGTTTQHTVLIQVGTATWSAVAAFTNSVLAVKSDGTLWSWGENSIGQLGLGDTTQRNSPVQVGSSADWTAIAAGDAFGYGVNAGKLWSWGWNSSSRLGLGDTTQRNSPVQVGSADWSAVFGGGFAPCGAAAAPANGLWMWGSNSNGQFGRGNTTSATTPEEITLSSGLVVYGLSMGTLHTLALLDAPTIISGSLDLPLTLNIGEIGAPTLGLTVNIINSGTLSLPLTINIQRTYTPALPLTVNLYDPAVFSESVPTTALLSTWRARVLIGGEDISAHLAGVVEVDAEASAARVAHFSMARATAFNPTQWLGASVSVDYLLAGIAWRLFTGSVSDTQVKLNDGLIVFTCSDNLGNVLANASQSQANALVGNGYHSPLLYGDGQTGQAYLTQRLASVPGDLDLSPTGVVRLSSWYEGTGQKTFTEADVLDGSASVRVNVAPSQSSNGSSAAAGQKIKVVVESRYPRLRTARLTVGWSAGSQTDFLPQSDTILDAMAGIDQGWIADRMTLTGHPSYTGAIHQMTAELSRRWVQDVVKTQTYTLIEAGVDANAPDTQTLRVNLVLDYDESAWVDRGERIQTSAPGYDLIDEANASIAAILNGVKKDVLAARRSHSVDFDLALDPTLDLPYTYRLNVARCDATGKADRIRHVMDSETGEATSTLSLALFGSPDGGTDAGDTAPIIPSVEVEAEEIDDLVLIPPVMATQVYINPAPGSGPDWDVSGWAVEVTRRLNTTSRTQSTEMGVEGGLVRDVDGSLVAYKDVAGYAYDIARSQFRIDIPQIPEIETSTATVRESETFTITLPSSSFNITF